MSMESPQAEARREKMRAAAAFAALAALLVCFPVAGWGVVGEVVFLLGFGAPIPFLGGYGLMVMALVTAATAAPFYFWGRGRKRKQRGLYPRGSRWHWWLAAVFWPAWAWAMYAGYSRYGHAANAPKTVAAVSPTGGGSEVSSSSEGAFVGLAGGRAVRAESRQGCLVIGPPGSGKTVGTMIPSVWMAPGAVVASSTKTDILAATFNARSDRGQCWIFDPAQAQWDLGGATLVRWSPLAVIHTWDDARRVARDLASTGGEDSHWSRAAERWLAVLTYAAAVGNFPMGAVADWLNAVPEGLVDAANALEAAVVNGDEGAGIAKREMIALISVTDRQRSGEVSTAQQAVAIYSSLAARQLATEINFDVDNFVRSSDSLYVCASEADSKIFAPIIVALLEAIRRAQYALNRERGAGITVPGPHLTFVLDEANTTAPLPMSEVISASGGQGLHVIVGIQSLAPARQRWGQAVDGWLTLFGTKVVMPGLMDSQTIEAVSVAAGEIEQERSSTNYSATGSERSFFETPGREGWSEGRSYSTERVRVLPPGEVAGLSAWTAIAVQGATPVKVKVQPSFGEYWINFR